MIGLGTLVNAATVTIGASIGLVIKKHLPQRIINIVFQAIGLFTIFIGVKMALISTHILVMVLSLVVGGLTGELMRLEENTQKLVDKFKSRFKFKDGQFTEGLLTAFLLFCTGSMSFIGAIEDGIHNDPTLLLTKSVMDGFSSMILAAGLGIGVLFSVVLLVFYQGSLTLLAAWLGQFVSTAVINEISAVGGVLLIGLGISILEIKKIKVLNLLPAIFYVPLFLWINSVIF